MKNNSFACFARVVLIVFPFVGNEMIEVTFSDDVIAVVIGESLFTLFASLTYAYHFMMTLIK